MPDWTPDEQIRELVERTTRLQYLSFTKRQDSERKRIENGAGAKGPIAAVRFGEAYESDVAAFEDLRRRTATEVVMPTSEASLGIARTQNTATKKAQRGSPVAFPLQSNPRSTLRRDCTAGAAFASNSLWPQGMELVGADGIEPSTLRV